MENVLIIPKVAAIIDSVIVYLIRSKKRGETCIACPYANQCSGKCKEHPLEDQPLI